MVVVPYGELLFRAWRRLLLGEERPPTRRRRPAEEISEERPVRARVMVSSMFDSMSRDLVKQCLEYLDGAALGRLACVSTGYMSGTRSAWPGLVRRVFPDAQLRLSVDVSTEASAKRFYRSQRRRRVLAERAGAGYVEAWRRPVVASLADVIFFVRITDGSRLVWEGDAKGNFEVDHIAVDLRDVWREAKPRWPHLAKLFGLRQQHGRRHSLGAAPDFVVDRRLEAAAFANVSVSLVAVRAADEKMCLLAKLTTVERVDLEDLDYALSTQPLATRTFMTFREPNQQPGIQGFLQFWTDDSGQADDEFDCLNLFMTAGKLSPPAGDFVEDYDLNQDEVTCLFDSLQWS